MIVDGFYVAQGNDYRGLGDLSPGADAERLDASVIIPVFNRVWLLDNVLAGLAEQVTTTPFDVTVVDDGSDDDVGAVVEEWVSALRIRHMRQERHGRGAGRARNLGVAHSSGAILFLLDADCIPDPHYIERHMTHHRKAGNLVVTASRRHVDHTVTRDDVRHFEALLRASGIEVGDEQGPIVPDDWRRVFFRRNQALILGDSAFRAVAGGLMSVHRARFEEVGGFDDHFRSWGGEDTELGWRLWNAGCFIVPEMSSTIVHQRAEDLEGAEGRASSREGMLALVADRVPHSFYRKEPSHLYSVPHLSVMVSVEDPDEAARAWRETSRASLSDSELVLVGPRPAIDRFRSVVGNPRLRLAETFEDAVGQSRGAIVAVIDGRAHFDRRLLARTVSRFDDPGVDIVRVGYRSGAARVLAMRGLEAIDEAEGRNGLPFFGLIRRRELMKTRNLLADPGEAWRSATERGRMNLLVTDLVDVPFGAADGVPSMPKLPDLRAAGVKEVARGARRTLRSRQGAASPSSPESTDNRVRISYVGLAGHRNLGDDVMLEAIRTVMPWARIEEGMVDPAVVMLGGGTLLNAGNYYLNKARRVDGPNAERVVFGTGFRSPRYWGETERFKDWQPFLDSAISVGVRGPASLDDLRAWGFAGGAHILGDPALLFEPAPDRERGSGRVVVCPLFTAGACWGGDDAAVFKELAGNITELTRRGHEVVMMTAHPADDRWAIEIMRAAGHPDLGYVAGYESTTASLDLIASADLVIGERLHAVVLAAAMDTPFVALEYRPKLRDFARSIGAEQWCIRTDELEHLRGMIEDRLATPEAFTDAVSLLRTGLRRDASDLAATLGVETTV